MIRAVLDANVFVSAILSPQGIPAKLLTAWGNDGFELVESPAILKEIERVLRYPRIAKRHGWSERQLAPRCRVKQKLDSPLGHGIWIVCPWRGWVHSTNRSWTI